MFGPVWTVLYLIIAISFGFVLLQYLKRRLPFGVLLPFILNLLFNVAYTPIQFGLKNHALASIDILLVLGTLVWALDAIWRRARWVALCQHSVFAVGGVCRRAAAQHYLA